MDPTIPPELAAWLPDSIAAQVGTILPALVALPFAAALGALLAFRPRRRGTPPRSASVIQTQIVLSVIGAVVMLVVGASLARAFGIVGAANLIRYRAKIDDPKDAVVMLATLSLGLACGVGLYGLAAFAALFILGVLWVVESVEPERRKKFEVKIAATDPAVIRDQVESILRDHRIEYELRSAGPKELIYAAALPLDVSTDIVATAILRLGRDAHEIVVAWDEKKMK